MGGCWIYGNKCGREKEGRQERNDFHTRAVALTRRGDFARILRDTCAEQAVVLCDQVKERGMLSFESLLDPSAQHRMLDRARHELRALTERP